MRNRRMLPVLLLPVLLLLARCGDRDERYDQWVGYDGPVRIADEMVYLDHNFDELLMIRVTPEQARPEWQRVEVSPTASILTPVSDQSMLLVKDSKTLELSGMVPGESEPLWSVELAGLYDRYTTNDESGILALFYSDYAQGTEDSLYVNKAEVSFVDYGHQGALSRFVIPTYGGAPLGVDLPPPLMSGGKTLTLGFVRWQSYLSVVNVNEPTSTPIRIPLKAPDSTATIVPGPLSFHQEGGRLQVFFISDGTTDLYLVDIDLAQFAQDGSGVSLNLFPTASGAALQEPYLLQDGTLKVLVLCRTSRTVAIVDPETSDVDLYTLDIVPRSVSFLERLNPDSGQVEKMALIMDNSGGATTYYLAQLEHLAEKKVKAFTAYTVPLPLESVALLPDGERFLAFHSTQSDTLSVVSIADGSIMSLGGGVDVTDRVFSDDHARLYVLGWRNGRQILSVLDTGTFSTNVVPMPTQASLNRIHLMEDGQTVVLTGSSSEDLVVVPQTAESSDQVVYIANPLLLGLEH